MTMEKKFREWHKGHAFYILESSRGLKMHCLTCDVEEYEEM